MGVSIRYQSRLRFKDDRASRFVPEDTGFNPLSIASSIQRDPILRPLVAGVYLPIPANLLLAPQNHPSLTSFIKGVLYSIINDRNSYRFPANIPLFSLLRG
jgi:hypothetical protein